MPPAIAAFPDIEKLLVNWLQPQFPDARLATILPADITETTIHVTRISGANRDIRVDRPIVDIDVFASDYGDSVATALAVQQALMPVRNLVTDDGTVLYVTTTNGPRWLPEINPALTRFSATYEFHVHA